MYIYIYNIYKFTHHTHTHTHTYITHTHIYMGFPRTWKQPRCPSTEKWIRKLWHMYTMSITQPLKRIHLNQF